MTCGKTFLALRRLKAGESLTLRLRGDAD